MGAIVSAKRSSTEEPPTLADAGIDIHAAHWNTMTFLAALRHDRIDGPWLTNGPINGERFLL